MILRGWRPYLVTLSPKPECTTFSIVILAILTLIALSPSVIVIIQLLVLLPMFFWTRSDCTRQSGGTYQVGVMRPLSLNTPKLGAL